MDEIYSPSPAASFFSLPLFVAVVEVEMCICDGVGTLAFFFWNVVHLKVVQC